MFIRKEIKSEKLILHLEVELNHSLLTAQEAVDRLQFSINSYKMKSFSEFVVDLLRETKSSTYEIKRLAID
jgi:hypothetical protein